MTDTWLPGVSGLDLCQLLRHDAMTKTVPIIVVSGVALATDLKLAEAAGSDAVLVKPCLPGQLAAEICRVLAMSTTLPRTACAPYIEQRLRIT